MKTFDWLHVSDGAREFAEGDQSVAEALAGVIEELEDLGGAAGAISIVDRRPLGVRRGDAIERIKFRLELVGLQLEIAALARPQLSITENPDPPLWARREAADVEDPTRTDALPLAMAYFKEHSPSSDHAIAQRQALRIELFGNLHKDLDRVPAQVRSLDKELQPVVKAVTRCEEQWPAGRELFIQLWNALLDLQLEVEEDERNKLVKSKLWTDHYIRKAAALQEFAEERIRAHPSETSALVRIRPEVELPDGFISHGYALLSDLAKGNRMGRPPEPHSERLFLTRFLVHSLQLPVEKSLHAAEILLSVYVSETGPSFETLNRWWYDLSEVERSP